MPFILDPSRAPGSEELAALSEAVRPLPARFVGAQDQMFSVDTFSWDRGKKLATLTLGTVRPKQRRLT